MTARTLSIDVVVATVNEVGETVSEWEAFVEAQIGFVTPDSEAMVRVLVQDLGQAVQPVFATLGISRAGEREPFRTRRIEDRSDGQVDWQLGRRDSRPTLRRPCRPIESGSGASLHHMSGATHEAIVSRLVAERDRALTPWPPHGSEPLRDTGVLHEREFELSALMAALDSLEQGSGRVIGIAGPPGIGKSALVGELVRAVRAAGVRALTSIASRDERASAYGIVRQLLDRPVREAGPDLLGGEAAPAASLFTSGAAADATGGLTVGLVHGLLAVIDRLCEDGPLVLVVDDAQWADVPSLRFLAFLARRLDDIPVLVVLARRSEPAGLEASPLESLVLPHEQRTLTLRALTGEGTATVLGEALGTTVAPEVAAAVHERTGGNPLLVVEFARAMLTNRIEPTAGNVDALERIGAAAAGPLIRMRLAQLSAAATALARAVAILGESAHPRLLREFTGLDREETAQALTELRRVEILTGHAPLTFVHPLMRDGVLEGLDPTEAERGHARAAELLAADGADPEVVARQLLHTDPAGDLERVRVLRHAAVRPLAAGDSETAAAYLRRALAEPPVDEDRPAVLLELAQAEAIRDGRAAVRHFEEVLPLIEDPVMGAQIRIQLASVYPGERSRDTLELGMEGVALLGDSEPELKRVLLTLVGVAAAIHPPESGFPAELRSMLERESRPVSDPGSRMARCVLAWVDCGRRKAASRIAARLEPAFEGDWLDAAALSGAPVALGVLALIAIDSPILLRVLDEWLERAKRHSQSDPYPWTGSLVHISGIHMLRAHAMLGRGRLDDARRDADQALELFNVWGVGGAAAAHAAAARAQVAIEQDDLDTASRVIMDALGGRDRDPGTPGLAGILHMRAQLRAAQDELRAALREMLQIGRRAAEWGYGGASVPWRSGAALLLHRLATAEPVAENQQASKHLERAAALAGEELDLARAWGTPRAVGRALTAAGLVAGGSEGEKMLDEAVNLLSDALAPLELARALFARGTLLLDRGTKAKAREDYRRALEVAERHGATALERRVTRALVAAGGRPHRAAASGPDSLTARERTITALAAAGQSNRAIASELGLTARTVELHLSNAYRKLGIHSRSELKNALSPHTEK